MLLLVPFATLACDTYAAHAAAVRTHIELSVDFNDAHSCASLSDSMAALCGPEVLASRAYTVAFIPEAMVEVCERSGREDQGARKEAANERSALGCHQLPG